ncbi:MAG: diguanylate cyclase [Planctomycetes bacterium]|nr:diguanylate cyclase [Planctomycetota bacterium]
MRIEFERSQRYKVQLVCLVISVDRMDRMQDLYGQEFKSDLLRGVQSLLRQTVRESDLTGTVVDDRVIVLVTHTPPEGARVLANRLLDGARKLTFRAGPRTIRVTLSIGGAHNQHGSNLFFDTLVEVAEGGLSVAQGAGGDRYVHSELYEFFQAKHERERRERGDVAPEFVPEPETVAPPPAAPEAEAAASPEALEPLPQSMAEMQRDVLRGLVAEEGTKALQSARRAQEALVHAIEDMQARGGDPNLATELDAYRRQIDLLERRIAKLTQLLAMTEDELRRLIDAKSIDPGVSSVYRSVQGLDDAVANAKAKKEVMKRIFQANLELKQQLSSGN